MVAHSHHRGHRMYFDESAQEWRYTDNKTLVKDFWKSRPCGNCGEHATPAGHDPCLGELKDVSNACCGHGHTGDAYIQFVDGRLEKGQKAIEMMKSMKGK